MIVKCRHCERGYRDIVGNCVLCGWGPAPAAVNFFGEPMPSTIEEEKIVLWKLFNGVFPPTLNDREYPSREQLNQ